QRVAARCDTQFFAGLAVLTGVYGEELRDVLAELLDQPRKPLAPPEVAKTPEAELGCGADADFVPGLAPGW
ncbi:MAG: hypothetical protein WC091_22335, partial [Sulfuricellaceae bacterium]